MNDPQELLARAREQIDVVSAQMGDREAFARLVARYELRLLYYLRRLLPETECLDALQDAWLTVFRRLRTLNSPAAFRVWLYRIARDAAIDRLRKRRRHDKLLESFALEKEDELTFSEEATLSIDDAELIHKGLSELSVPHREVITLRFMEGLSCDEIAEVVGRPAGTVKSRLHHALRQMREHWEKVQHV